MRIIFHKENGVAFALGSRVRIMRNGTKKSHACACMYVCACVYAMRGSERKNGIEGKKTDFFARDQIVYEWKREAFEFRDRVFFSQ